MDEEKQSPAPAKRRRKKDAALELANYLTTGDSAEETLFKINELLYAEKFQSTRRHDRAPIRLPVLYRAGGPIKSAVSYTLSQGGMFIKCPDPPPLGSLIDIHLNAPEGESIEVKGRVIQSKGLSDAVRDSTISGMSVVFEKITQEDRRRVQRLVKNWIRSLK